MKWNILTFNIICLILMIICMVSRLLIKQYYPDNIGIIILEAVFYIIFGMGLGSILTTFVLE